MIDNIAICLKVAIAIIGIWQIHKGRVLTLGIPLLMIPAFMTGVELVSAEQDAPWEFLLTGNASEDDIFKALFGGALLMCFPILLFALCVKDISAIIEQVEKNHTR